MSWTEKKEERMIDLWKKGLTTREIANDIDKTMISVSSKLRRLGLVRNNEVKKNKKERREIQESEKFIIARTIYGEKTNLIDLKSDQCCWPVGDPKKQGFGFCGAPRHHGSKNYCENHHNISYRS